MCRELHHNGLFCHRASVKWHATLSTTQHKGLGVSQDIDEKAEEAYRKMEKAFKAQLGLIPEGVAVT